MIKLLRIDDRLVHGQVALTWTPAIGADCLLVANDAVAKDDFQKMTLQLAKPANAKLLVKSLTDAVTFLRDARSAPMKVLVLVNAIKDAAALAEQLPEIISVNLGGLRNRPATRQITRAVALTEDEIALARKMEAKGLELEVRQVPTDTKQLLAALL